jgi:lipopolysaccharide transport system ATP-binding protein
MSKVVIKAENISKQYRLGLVGTGTIRDDMKRWWYKMRGAEDPFLKIGEANDRSSKGESDYVWSLQNINFEINQGDSVGIIGKNGAGKSTLLKILSQVTQPTTGKIYTKGRIASLLEVGTGFHPELTGRENIFLNGAILGMRKHEIARKLDEIIAFSGVERYIDTPVKRYSSGMYVRLAFAVAAHLESEILIVDEVLAVGDADFQKKCLGKMNDVSKGEGRTVLFVSHNMAAVEALCNTAITLKNGNLIDSGNPSKLIKRYLLENSANNRKFNFSTIEDAIGNDAIKILSASVNNASSINPDDFIELASNIEISFEILNLTQNEELSVGFDLKTTRGEILFGSGTTVTCSQNNTTKVICQIPGNLLNDDTYQIFLYIHTKTGRLLFMKDEILSFEIKDAKREEGYLGKVNGFIRPSLNWKK